MRLTSEYSNLSNGILYSPHNYENPTNNEGSLIQEMRDNIKKAFLDASKSNQKDAFFDISQKIETNREKLKKITISTSDINALLEEIRNTEIFSSVYPGQNFYQISTEMDIPCNSDDIIFLYTN